MSCPCEACAAARAADAAELAEAWAAWETYLDRQRTLTLDTRKALT